MQRRRFFHTATGAAVSLSQFPYALFASARPKSAIDRITLGPKKIVLSRLAQGSGTNGVSGSSNQTRKLGVEGLADLFRAGFDQGINFFDTADQYGTHPHVARALSTVPRDKVVLLSKTRANTAAEMRADLDRFRRELKTDYIDILLLHCVLEKNWNVTKRGAMDVLEDAQAKGIIRSKGVSCHTLDALKTAAVEPWVEIDLARLNPAQAAMDADPNTVIGVLKEMKAAGKGVIGMKILGAGKLRGNVDEALQFALAQDVLDCFTIGSENRAEMEDLLRKIPAASVRG